MKKDDIIALFCCIDDFCQLYEECNRNKLIPLSNKRRREGKLRLSYEVENLRGRMIAMNLQSLESGINFSGIFNKML